jgi:hypothetical protein
MKNILKYLSNNVFGSSMILVTVEFLKTASMKLTVYRDAVYLGRSKQRCSATDNHSLLAAIRTVTLLHTTTLHITLGL